MGKVSNLLSGIRGSKRWFAKNSDLYQTVVDTANEYASKMKERVTYKSAKELSEIEERLKAASEAYLAARKGPISVEGRARRKFVEQARSLIGVGDELRDPNNIKKFSDEGKLLSEVVDEVRNNKVVDITNKQKTVYGAGASKRIKFEHEGIEGFFTEEESVKKISQQSLDEIKFDAENFAYSEYRQNGYKMDAREKVEAKYNQPGYKQLLKEQIERKHTQPVSEEIINKEIEDMMSKEIGELVKESTDKSLKKDIAREIKNHNMKLVVENINKKYAAANPQLWEKMTASGLTAIDSNDNMYDSKLATLNSVDAFAAVSKIAGDFREFHPANYTEEELKGVTGYFKELSKVDTAFSNMSVAQMSDSNRVSKRNVATSRVADVLGMNDNIASAKHISILDKGVKAEGSFMEKVDGCDTRSQEGIDFCSWREFDLSDPAFHRELNRMQVFDMLCGQIDRHAGNLIYKIDKNPENGKYKITGMKGIDNDLSFGNLELKEHVVRLPSINELTVIDKDMVTALTEFTPEKIKFALGEMLSPDEIDAVIERRQAILIRARSGQADVIGPNEWGSRLAIEANKASSYYKEIEKEFNSATIAKMNQNVQKIKEYDEAVKRIEAYNAMPEHTIPQKLPTKPECYDEFKEYVEMQDANGFIMDNYERALENREQLGDRMPEKPQGYDEYKAKEAVFIRKVKIQAYEKEVETLKKEGKELPDVPEWYVDYRAELVKDERDAKMQAYEKERAEMEKQGKELPKMPEGYPEYKRVETMKAYEKEKAEMEKAGNPLPEMPEGYLEYKANHEFEEKMQKYEDKLKVSRDLGVKAPEMPSGYLDYRKAKELSGNLSRQPETLSDIMGKKPEITRMGKANNQPQRDLEKAPAKGNMV